MKKTLSIISIALLSFQSQAQSIIPKIGINFANMTATYIGDADIYNARSGIDRGYESNIGFHIGVLGELPLNDMLFFESGLLVTNKGFNNVVNQGTFIIVPGVPISPKQYINFTYLDIPVSLKAKIDLNTKPSYYVSLGGYLGLGIAASSRFVNEVDGVFYEGSGPVEFGSDDIADFSKTDFGLTIGIGVEFEDFIFGFYSDLGIANVSSTYEDFNKLLYQKHKVFKFSLGYRLSRKQS